MRPAKTQISLRIRAVWSVFANRAFYSLWAVQREINDNTYCTGWMYRLIFIFVGHLGLILGFVVRWLICLRVLLGVRKQ